LTVQACCMWLRRMVLKAWAVVGGRPLFGVLVSCLENLSKGHT